MTAELEVLSDVVGRLDRAAIPYMLTGSIALSYYAQPRMTRDIDLVVELAGRDAKSVEASEMQLRDVRALVAGDVDRHALVDASLPEGLDPAERRFRVCERFYGDLAARALGRSRTAR